MTAKKGSRTNELDNGWAAFIRGLMSRHRLKVEEVAALAGGTTTAKAVRDWLAGKHAPLAQHQESYRRSLEAAASLYELHRLLQAPVARDPQAEVDVKQGLAVLLKKHQGRVS